MNKQVCIMGDIYSTYIHGNQGGGENQLLILARSLTKIGFIVKIVDTRITTSERIENGIEFFPIEGLNSLFDKITKKTFSIYKVLVKLNCDYYVSSMGNFQQILLLLASKKNKSKFYYWVAADLEVESLRARIKFKYLGKIKFRNLLYYLLDELIFPYVLKTADIVFVQHSAQLNHDFKNAVILNNVSPDFGQIKDKSNYFIWVGSVDFDKGFQYLEPIIKECPDIKFKVVGKIRAAGCIPILERMLSHNNFEYLGFIKKNEDLLTLIGQAKALLNTSLKEGFPITFIEAWSVNTAVLSLNVDPGGVINREGLGFCAKGNYNAYVNYIKSFHRSDNGSLRNYYLYNHSLDFFEKNLKKYFIL